MAKSKNVDGKTIISLRLTEDLLRRLDEWMARNSKLNRSEALRSIIAMALNSSEQLPIPPWMEKLENLAQRVNTDAAGAVDLLADYLSEPEHPGGEKTEDISGRRKRGMFRGLMGL